MSADTVLLRPSGGALVPADRHSVEIIGKLEEGKPIAARLLRSRSHRQNALYWRVLERVVDATGRWRTPQELHAALRIATGHVDAVLTFAGKRVLVPASTAFDALSQEAAQAYYDAAFRLLSEVMDCSIDELTSGPRSDICDRVCAPLRG